MRTARLFLCLCVLYLLYNNYDTYNIDGFRFLIPGFTAVVFHLFCREAVYGLFSIISKVEAPHVYGGGGAETYFHPPSAGH